MICVSTQLEDGGAGVRFEIERSGESVSAFAIRHEGKVYGYLNRCGHVPVELDWQPGEFYDYSRLYLICTVHGALYDPASGECLLGRCNGHGLVPVPLTERDGGVYRKED